MTGKPRRWPPAYAARWDRFRRSARCKRPRALDVHLGWSGRDVAARYEAALWLPPDRDPELSDWRCARNTAPWVYQHDADRAHALGVCHALLAVGCELVILYDGADRAIFTNFAELKEARG